MLDHILETTRQFLENMPKSIRKKKGQFFTSKATAEYMAKMFDLSDINGVVEVLDPGSGTGILSAALVSRLQNEKCITGIHLTCYETDPDVLPVLRENLKYLSENSSIKLEYTICEVDYLISQSDAFSSTLFDQGDSKKYDLIIANPPYLRIPRDDPAALSMPKVVHGAPNLYFLFASMSLFNLEADREMVYIIPRSWTSGLYFKAFREYLLTEGKLEHVHLFVSRDKVFSEEEVLQETIIIKVRKTSVLPKYVLITSSESNQDFNNLTELKVPYSSIVTGKDLYVFLLTQPEDIETVRKINRFHTTFPDIGLRMKTGIVVDFRQWDDLRAEPGDGIVPLFYSQHIRDGRVNHLPSGKDADWISDAKPSLVQDNKNYVFCKRFTAKEERRRLQCGIYLANDFPEYKRIGTQNKINFVDSTAGDALKEDVVYGIYALLNSSLFDMYYRVLNGSTQVNSTEINSIPVPPYETIEAIGTDLLAADDLSTITCDRIIEKYYK